MKKVVVIAAAMCTFLSCAKKRHIEKIHIGMKVHDVNMIMGKPDSIIMINRDEIGLGDSGEVCFVYYTSIGSSGDYYINFSPIDSLVTNVVDGS